MSPHFGGGEQSNVVTMLCTSTAAVSDSRTFPRLFPCALVFSVGTVVRASVVLVPLYCV